jgi:5-methylcytosine-specific restriction endonuclease McrA
MDIFEIQITDAYDRYITWIDRMAYRDDYGVGKKDDYRKDVIIIPVAYITTLLSLDFDYNDFWTRLLEKSDDLKRYFYEMREEEKRAEELALQERLQVRNKRYASLGLCDLVCAYCGKDLSREYAEIDHINPRSKGGLNVRENYVLSCYRCNQIKLNRTPEESNMPIRYGDCNLLRTNWF